MAFILFSGEQIMRSIVMSAAVAALMMGAASVATAQEGLFHAPVFVAQPGIVRLFSDGASTEFNARLVTVLPLSIDRTSLVAIVQWTPFADNAAGGRANSPAFVYGPVVNLLNQKYWSFDIDGLFAYGPAATGKSDYTHKLLAEGDLNAKGQWNGLSAYAMLAYVVSGLPSDVESKDRMVLLSGLSLPLAPWKK
jgi:hypothetical protein